MVANLSQRPRKLLTMNADTTAHKGRQSWLNIQVLGLAMILAVGFFSLQQNAQRPVRENVLPFVSENGANVTMTEKAINWIDLGFKPLIFEVGGVVLCQVIGLPVIRIVSKVLWRSRRLRWLPHLRKLRLWNEMTTRVVQLTSKASSKMATRIVQRTSKISRFLRRMQKTAIRLYKKRSRLSIASEYTNFIGNDSSEKVEGSASKHQSNIEIEREKET